MGQFFSLLPLHEIFVFLLIWEIRADIPKGVSTRTVDRNRCSFLTVAWGSIPSALWNFCSLSVLNFPFKVGGMVQTAWGVPASLEMSDSGPWLKIFKPHVPWISCQFQPQVWMNFLSVSLESRLSFSFSPPILFTLHLS